MKEIVVMCNTKDCVENKITRIIKWDGMSSVQLSQSRECPQCGLPRSIMDVVFKETENDFSSIGIGRIASMTPIERKQLLKKRSNDHYEKEIKPRKKYLDSEVFKPK